MKTGKGRLGEKQVALPRKAVGIVLHECGLWCLVLMVMFVPLVNVWTRTWPGVAFLGLVAFMSATGIGAMVVFGRPWEMPWLVVLGGVFLFAGGWMVTMNGPRLSPDAFGPGRFGKLIELWPGYVLERSAKNVMGLYSVWGAVMLLLSYPPTTEAWKVRLFRAMMITGCAVSALGVVQVMTGAAAPFWRSEAIPVGSSYFGTFFEESVGVGFVVLLWPMAVGELIAAIGMSRAAKWMRWAVIGGWAGAVILGWIALGVTGSMVGLCVGGGTWLAIGVWLLWRVPRKSSRAYGITAGAVVLLCGSAFTSASIASGRAPAFRSHWTRLQSVLAEERRMAGVKSNEGFGVRPDGLLLSDDDPSDPQFAEKQRQKIFAACMRMIPEAGLLGFGPGTWGMAYPHFTDDALVRSHYLQMQYAMNDFLQALVEWGVLGTAAWATLFLSGISAGAYRLRRYRARGGYIGEEEGMVAGAMAGLCGVLACAWWSCPLQVPAIQLYVAVVLGFLWSVGARHGWGHVAEKQDVFPKRRAT